MLKEILKPRRISLKYFGQVGKGVLGVANIGEEVPFEVKRVTWIDEVADTHERGNHANRETIQFFVALRGIITVTLTDRHGVVQEFVLDSPKEGLVVPPEYYRTLVFESNALLIALNSHDYDEADYIRDSKEFLIAK